MKRTISELKSNTEYSEINDMQKQLYLENQKRLQQTEAIVIDEDKEDKKDKEMEQEQLCFEKGTFCINCLTQYPKEERKEHIMPFVNLLFENSNIDAKVQKPKKSLQNALMTCYGFEDQLLEPLAKQGIELTIVNDNDNANKKTEIIEKYRGYQNWLIIKPSKHGSNSYGGAFHPKIWILKFPNFIRIVIGSQNLHVADWTVWSQAMWVQDFKKGSSKLDDNSSEFKTLLKEFMLDILPTNYKFQDLLKITFDDYDFSNINIRLITSIPGRYTGNSLYKYGIMRLYNVINQEQLKNKFEQKSSAITYQTTSIGQLEYNYIDLIKQCCIGKSYKPTSEGQATLSNQNSIAQESQLKLIYPTMDYIVNKTHGGIDFANPLFLKKQQFENPKFPKQLFHRFQGNEHYYWHEGTIPHLKVIIITNLECEINDESSIYIGSHNLSLAAWGKLEKNNTQLFIANTELGVLYPPGKDTTEIKKDIINKLPFKFPPEKYEKDEKPWIAELYYELQQK